MGAVDEVLEPPQAEHVFTRFDADTHLVAVIGRGVAQPVHSGADEGSQHAPVLGDLPCSLPVWLLARQDAHMVMLTDSAHERRELAYA